MLATAGGGYSLTIGGKIAHAEVNKLGLNFTFSWSGSEDIVTSIVYADIVYFSVWNFPKAKGLSWPPGAPLRLTKGFRGTIFSAFPPSGTRTT